MSAEVETMVYVREKPWHGLGVRVEEALTSAQALEIAKLDWNIEPKPIYDGNGNVIKGFYANTRDKDSKVMGIVGSRYTVVQNRQAFEFTDALIGEGIKYETAGSLKGGRKIWLLGRMPERYIAGDKVEPYICFTNTHDGTGAVRACMTPIRVVCNNTLNLALSQAKRSWSTPHRGDVIGRIDEARQTLQLADEYLIKLDETADRLANERFDEGDVKKALDTMFAVPKDASDRQKKTADDAKNEVILYMMRPDIEQFLWTKWGFVNAVSDYVGHSNPIRQTKNYEANRWESIIGGNTIFDKAVAIVNA